MGERLCLDCQAKIEYLTGSLCERCGYPLSTNTPTADSCDRCRRIPFLGQGLRSLAWHTGPLRAAIHALKYKNNPALAESLAKLMSQGWPMVLPAQPVFVPVPLAAERQHQRGFNQSEVLARHLAQARHGALLAEALQRVRATPSQVGLTAQQRRQNMAGAFAVGTRDVNGLNIVLLDDVCTTGATLGACAEALLQSGAKSVWAYTLARAPLADAELSHQEALQ